MKSIDEAHHDGISPQRQWQALRLGYLLLGGIILLVGIRQAIQYISSEYHIFIKKDNLILWLDANSKSRYRQLLRWRTYMGLALAVVGGSLVVLPHLVEKGIDEAHRGGKSPQRQWQALRLGYLLLGGIILLMGLQYVQFFTEEYQLGYYSLVNYRRDFYIGSALAAAGGGLAALPYLVLKDVDKINVGSVLPQRLWMALRLGYLLLGGIILLVGLQDALHYIEEYQICLSSECSSILRWKVYKSLVKTGIGGSLIPLTYIVLGRIQDRTRRNQR